MDTISILGCGWLGLPLAKRFIAEGYRVKGSTATEDKLSLLKNEGIDASHLVLDPYLRGGDLEGFFNTDILIVNFPPERRPDIVEYHQTQILSLIDFVEAHSNLDKILYVSSTSVYPNVNREVSEDEELEPDKLSGKALRNVENILLASQNFKTTVIRFSGLIGYDRMPGRFLAGKKAVANADAPVNLIHRDDCINIISRVIEREVWGEVLNASSDTHPTRQDFYVNEARKLGLEPPMFTDMDEFKYKIVKNNKLKTLLDYSFIHPDPAVIIEEQTE